MTDLNELSQALLAAVPEDGSSIGNQALMETLKAQFSDLTDEVFTAARETLVASLSRADEDLLTDLQANGIAIARTEGAAGVSYKGKLAL